jgi:hypothetical protein
MVVRGAGSSLSTGGDDGGPACGFEAEGVVKGPRMAETGGPLRAVVAPAP